jgi:hypothetical protein
MKEATAAFSAMFAQGVEGYAGNRLADGRGWVSIDVSVIRCPVTVLRGGSDRIIRPRRSACARGLAAQ